MTLQNFILSDDSIGGSLLIFFTYFETCSIVFLLNTWQLNFIITANTLIKPGPQLAIRECTIYIDGPGVPVVASEQYIYGCAGHSSRVSRCNQQLENPIQLLRLSTPGAPTAVVTIST